MGYNQLLNSSLSRDCDLVATPWLDQPTMHLELIQRLDYSLKLKGENSYNEPSYYLYSVLPGNSHSYVINIYRGEHGKGGKDYTPRSSVLSGHFRNIAWQCESCQ